MQSLIRKGEVNSLVGEYGQIIVDECHHVSAFTFERILRHAKAKYVLGLTATPIRKDGHHPIILMQCGPIRFNLSAKKLGATQTFDHLVTPRFTHFSVPPEWSEISIKDLYTALALDEQRTDQVVSDVLEAVRQGRSPLVLTIISAQSLKSLRVVLKTSSSYAEEPERKRVTTCSKGSVTCTRNGPG